MRNFDRHSRPDRGHQDSYSEESRRKNGARPSRGEGLFGFGPSGRTFRWIFGIFLVLFAAVGARLFYLQIIDHDTLSNQAEQHRTNVVTLQAKRGTIYDRNGNVLATDEECYDIYCNPKEVSDAQDEALMLKEAFGASAQNYYDALTRDTTFAYLVRKADKATAEKLQSDLAEKGYTGIYLLSTTKRVYPYGQAAGQILGMVDTDGNGITGLELYYNDVLSGTDGEETFETGLGGTPIAGGVSETTQPTDGQDIVLSIDIDVQKAAEKVVSDGVTKYKADSGMCMITNPKTGEIIAACSTPYADLSDTSTISNDGLTLKEVSSSYEPGSIFKVLTMAIGIEDGIITPDSTFSVPGSIVVGSDTVRDDDLRSATMDMSVREILRRSSNVGAALIAQQEIGAQNFSEGISKFQIGQKTGIDYPGESDGIVKSLEDYESSSLGSMAFGQGLAIPMVQMVKAVGAIADGGWLMTPHFVTKVGDQVLNWDTTGQAVSAETATEVTDMMRTVMTEGTGTTGQVEGYDIAGKTGTGEQADESGYVAGKYLASLIGFAPASDAQVLCYVGLHNTPYLSTYSAAPTFSAIMGEALSELGVAPES